MDNALVGFLTALQLVWWPISKLIYTVRIILSPILHAVVFILSPIWIVGGFLLLPLIHLARGLFYIVTLPLQVKWLERIETLYIFLGTAGIIGCMTGALLYFIFKFLSSSLSIDATSGAAPRKGRTTADFRSARRERREKLSIDQPSPSRVVTDRVPASKRRGLLSLTIAEEEDSDL